MAQVNRKTPAFVSKLTGALVSELERVGIKNAKVSTEPVKGTKLFRVTVVATGFAHMRHSERQDLVWRIAAEHLAKDQQLFVSMIWTLTPPELEGQIAA